MLRNLSFDINWDPFSVVIGGCWEFLSNKNCSPKDALQLGQTRFWFRHPKNCLGFKPVVYCPILDLSRIINKVEKSLEIPSNSYVLLCIDKKMVGNRFNKIRAKYWHSLTIGSRYISYCCFSSSSIFSLFSSFFSFCLFFRDARDFFLMHALKLLIKVNYKH